ncbi:hypothetical protein ECRM9975_28020 (plasmid) [Escherichia coli]|nr:hypothetical protein ECRM9131_28250 [Escherichia coli]AWZ60616.1 hypothetical protein ECRM9975_28020 [Escherichia coli]EFE7405837.1 hypothetical protein [Escherichia coli]EFH6291867.1 hypothetical protein [Escherichia coli]EFI8921362.1 hypothetical protein [Escherichia coli]
MLRCRGTGRRYCSLRCFGRCYRR